METVQTIPEWKTAIDEIWAMMKETDRRRKETDRRIEATDRQIEATNRQMKATDKRVGELTNRFGEMVEHMVIPNLLTKFNELGMTFTKANRTEIKDREHNIFTEVDAFLENGERVMIVETKTKPTSDDINDHIERMEKLRQYADLHDDKRKYRGAVAGLVFGTSEKTYALKKGLYVIEPSGDTFTIIEPKGSYYPHEW
jgi:transposase